MDTISLTPGSIRFSSGSDRSGHAPAGFRKTVNRQVRNTVVEILNAVVRWQQRYEMRRALLTMDESTLRDIGRSRTEVEAEARRMFRLF